MSEMRRGNFTESQIALFEEPVKPVRLGIPLISVWNRRAEYIDCGQHGAEDDQKSAYHVSA